MDQKIDSFCSAEEDKESLLITLSQTESALKRLGELLTCKRKESASFLSSLIQAELTSLNMSHSEILISVEPTHRSLKGEDSVSFWLKANQGEAFTPIKDHTSGGELSRLFLAIKLCLAEKNNIPTLLFDEIDANVGGKTATLIGEKLLCLSSHCQVLCITHFPQVANLATSHFLVQKITQNGRTFSTVTSLDDQGREIERLRMLGGCKKNLAL